MGGGPERLVAAVGVVGDHAGVGPAAVVLDLVVGDAGVDGQRRPAVPQDVGRDPDVAAVQADTGAVDCCPAGVVLRCDPLEAWAVAGGGALGRWWNTTVGRRGRPGRGLLPGALESIADADSCSTPATGRGSRGLSGGRLLLIAVAVVLFLLVVFARGIAGVYTDFLWFDSLGFAGVWRGILGRKVLLGFVFGAVFFGLAWGNLAIADRFAPQFRPSGPEEEALSTVHVVVERRRRLVHVLVALVPAVAFGAAAAAKWNEWLLFRNRVSFGTNDPQFGNDVGFYVFQLPWLSFVANWIFGALVVTTLLATAAHYVNGGIRLRAPGLIVTSAVKAHVSVLVAVIALIKAGNYLLDRVELLFSDRGVVRGAGYTDVNAQLPAINLLIAISVLAAALLLYGSWRRSWRLPVIAVGLWAFVSLIVGGIYPAVVQRFRVEPAESTRETLYIGRNIEATRAAMGARRSRGDASSPTTRTSPQKASRTTPRRSATSASGIPSRAAAHVPEAPRGAHLLPLQRRRRRPLHDRRRADADRAVGSRDQPGQPALRHLGEPSPRVHPRLRSRPVTCQRGDLRRSARLPRPEHPAAG